jgi:excinuclease ABC subunit C
MGRMPAVALTFRPDDAEFFAQVPARAAVFAIRGEQGTEPYVSKTSNLKRRLLRLLAPGEERSRLLNLRTVARTVEFMLTGSDFESQLRLYRALREAFPKTYGERLRLRFPPLIKYNLDNPYPRAYVTHRVSSLKGKSVYFGPFATRAAAEKYLNDSLDFFKLRRCDFEIHPDPAYPGCVYSEMKMCLAPCFAGCTDDEYRRETERVAAYLESAGRSLERELADEREKASAELAFETAAAVHARVEKIAEVGRERPEIARRLDQLNGLVVQPAAEAGAVALFPLAHGMMGEPLMFHVEQSGGKMQSMESRIQEVLAQIEPPRAHSALELMENLAILKRWHFRSMKLGELFLTDEKGELPLRRVVRGVSRVFKGEKAEVDLSTTAAREYWLARARAQQEEKP